MGFTLTLEELISYLKENGFHEEVGGRHQVMMVRGKLRIPIPSHKRDLAKGTVAGILKAAELSNKAAKKWKEGK
jgi:predicted RNA binding protein YcfA (HicA-like mRNA interferase family)